MKESNKQKIKKFVIEAGKHILIGGAMVLCWWGLLMPELLMNKDTFRVVGTKEGYEYKIEDWDMYDLYMEILQADEEQVVYKSKLLEYLKEAGIL